MIPISSVWCLYCRTRYDALPQYCHMRVTVGSAPARACPGPVVQFFVNEPEPPTLADVDVEAVA